MLMNHGDSPVGRLHVNVLILRNVKYQFKAQNITYIILTIHNIYYVKLIFGYVKNSTQKFL